MFVSGRGNLQSSRPSFFYHLRRKHIFYWPILNAFLLIIKRGNKRPIYFHFRSVLLLSFPGGYLNPRGSGPEARLSMPTENSPRPTLPHTHPSALRRHLPRPVTRFYTSTKPRQDTRPPDPYFLTPNQPTIRSNNWESGPGLGLRTRRGGTPTPPLGGPLPRPRPRPPPPGSSKEVRTMSLFYFSQPFHRVLPRTKKFPRTHNKGSAWGFHLTYFIPTSPTRPHLFFSRMLTDGSCEYPKHLTNTVPPFFCPPPHADQWAIRIPYTSRCWPGRPAPFVGRQNREWHPFEVGEHIYIPYHPGGEPFFSYLLGNRPLHRTHLFIFSAFSNLISRPPLL